MVGETMGEPFFHAVEGLEGYGALGCVWEVLDCDRVGNGNGVGVGGGFNGREGEVPIGDRNRSFSNIGDVSVHGVVVRRPWGRQGGCCR